MSDTTTNTASLLDTDTTSTEGNGNVENTISKDASGAKGDSVDTASKPTWIEQVKGDLRDNELLGKYSTVTDAAMRLIELEGSMEKAIFKPGEDATEEQREAYYNALGRPESADKYDLSVPEAMPETLRPTDEILAGLKEKFHSWGVTQEQGQNFLDLVNGFIMDGHENITKHEAAEREAAEKAINDQWGDKAKENVALANRALQNIGGDAFKSFLKSKGLANAPEMVAFLYNVSKMVTDDSAMDNMEKGTGSMRRSTSGLPMLNFPSMKNAKK